MHFVRECSRHFYMKAPEVVPDELYTKPLEIILDVRYSRRKGEAQTEIFKV